MVAETRIRLPGREAPFEIVWDELGIPHVFADSRADAFRGMGYVEGYERLWQIHLSCLYAAGEAAGTLGERFVRQDLMHRAFDVPAHRSGVPASEGDSVVDAYLDGLNAYVDSLEETPAEFVRAGARPRRFTRADVAARYRFSSWFQHRSWPEKLFLGRIMARHGVDLFRGQVSRFSDQDEAEVRRLSGPLRAVDPRLVRLVYPEAAFPAPASSGSNNWAVVGRRTASGLPLLATDPHQPHSIPNTFFYVHLHAPDWDVFGASFPGVPYFMMGFTRHTAWGLTTGMIDNYDVYVEETAGDQVRTAGGWAPLARRMETIAVRDAPPRRFDIVASPHGPLLEPLAEQLGLAAARRDSYRTSVRWALQHNPTSAGALALLPYAESAEAFGQALFEGDVSPLVNNIICVDVNNSLRRFIAATLPRRQAVTGAVPLAGWDAEYDFEQSTAAELTVEIDPPSGESCTANNDTLGAAAPYPIHTFPASPARAGRIGELLRGRSGLASADFEAMQMDLLDLRARHLVGELLPFLDGGDERLDTARALLRDWDFEARVDSAAAALYYTFLDRFWHRRFLVAALGDDFAPLPAAAPALLKAEPSMYSGEHWQAHRETLASTIREVFGEVVDDLAKQLGAPANWSLGSLQQVRYWHTLRRSAPWRDMTVGPDPLGGSATTLAMAMHVGNGPGRDPGVDEVPQRVFHGPAFRLVVDLADPLRCRFVIASGNSGRPGSDHVADHYRTWLAGGHYTVSLRRQDIEQRERWVVR